MSLEEFRVGASNTDLDNSIVQDWFSDGNRNLKKLRTNLNVCSKVFLQVQCDTSEKAFPMWKASLNGVFDTKYALEIIRERIIERTL